jgi:hypothetical protein
MRWEGVFLGIGARLCGAPVNWIGIARMGIIVVKVSWGILFQCEDDV